MNQFITFLLLILIHLCAFSQVMHKEMFVLRYSNIEGKCDNDNKSRAKVCFYHSDLVLAEYSTRFNLKPKIHFYKSFEKGIYSFFRTQDSVRLEYDNTQVANLMQTLSNCGASAYNQHLNNIAFLKINKQLKKDIFNVSYIAPPEWTNKNMYIEVFQAKISYVYVGKAACLLPNFKYNKRTRKKEPLMTPLVCNAYEIVGVEYFKPYKLVRKRIRLR